MEIFYFNKNSNKDEEKNIEFYNISENIKKYIESLNPGDELLLDNLTKEQERSIKAWIDKSISIDDCIKLTELSRATIFRAKKKLLV